MSRAVKIEPITMPPVYVIGWLAPRKGRLVGYVGPEETIDKLGRPAVDELGKVYEVGTATKFGTPADAAAFMVGRTGAKLDERGTHPAFAVLGVVRAALQFQEDDARAEFYGRRDVAGPLDGPGLAPPDALAAVIREEEAVEAGLALRERWFNGTGPGPGRDGH